MFGFIIKVIKKLLLIDYIKLFKANRQLLKTLSDLTNTDLDDKVIETINKVIEGKTIAMPNELKQKVAQKLSADKKFIPELSFGWDEKQGFKTHVNLTL